MTEITGEPTCYRHPRREAGVRCVRCERPICPDCMRAAPVGFQCPECVGAANRGSRRPRTVYGGRPVATAAVTWALVGINVAVFVATAVGGTTLGFGGSGDTSPLYRDLALAPLYTADTGQYYRLLTAMFLHYGLLHIAFNMWALIYIGPPLELALGRLRYGLLYLLAGIGGNVAAYVFGPPLVPSAGASGAVFGLFGAYAVIARQQRRSVGGIGLVIAVNLVFSFTFPNIDWQAHIGGLVIGAAAAWVLVYLHLGRRPVVWQAAVLVGLSGVLVVAMVLRTGSLRADTRSLLGVAGQAARPPQAASITAAASSAPIPSRYEPNTNARSSVSTSSTRPGTRCPERTVRTA